MSRRGAPAKLGIDGNGESPPEADATALRFSKKVQGGRGVSLGAGAPRANASGDAYDVPRKRYIAVKANFEQREKLSELKGERPQPPGATQDVQMSAG